MRLNIHHVTHYRFSQTARFTIQYLRLSPKTDESQRVIDWAIRAPGKLTGQTDGFGNLMNVLVVDEPHQEIAITAQGTVESHDTVGVLPPAGLERPSPILYLRPTDLTLPVAPVRDFAEPLRARMAADRLDGLHELSRRVAAAVAYRPDSTDVATSAGDALTAGAGVCQDQAHVFAAAARVLGVPTRYVSGYVHVHGSGTDETASHAWCEAWVDGLGWVAFDVTNEICANDAHVRLAVGPDYLACAPVRGMRRGGGAETLAVNVKVAAVDQ
jgi:transglutaminase-like putative cysteine protease